MKLCILSDSHDNRELLAAAVRDADTLLLTVPNQLGVDFNAKLLGTVVRQIAPAVGWAPKPRL